MSIWTVLNEIKMLVRFLHWDRSIQILRVWLLSNTGGQSYKNFLRLSFINFRNKLERLFAASLSNLVLYLRVRPEPTLEWSIWKLFHSGRLIRFIHISNICGQGWSLPELIPYRTLHCNGKLIALPANIKMGWKWMAVSNTIAYYNTGTITATKSFIVLASVGGVQPKYRFNVLPIDVKD
jgi:hypothetical protein